MKMLNSDMNNMNKMNKTISRNKISKGIKFLQNIYRMLVIDFVSYNGEQIIEFKSNF